MKSLVRWMLSVTFSPPRCVYDPDNTVSAITSDNNELFIRTKFEFKTAAGLNIMGSLWRDQFNSNPQTCAIFLHSLGTNQFEALNIVPFLCTPELAMFSFDFPGCGLSEGDIIPLDGSGAEIVKTCIDNLRSTFGIRQFALWGRSMGAAIALHTVSLYNEFCCIVSDSSFSCTQDVIQDQAKVNGYPSFLVRCLMPIIRKEAKDGLRTNVDVPFPIKFIGYARCPLLMGHGSRDTFVPVHQAEDIFKKYGVTDKQLYFFDAKHNSPRPCQWYQTAARFIYRHARIERLSRYYEITYRLAELHIGPVNEVVAEINQMIETERIRQIAIQNLENNKEALIDQLASKAENLNAPENTDAPENAHQKVEENKDDISNLKKRRKHKKKKSKKKSRRHRHHHKYKQRSKENEENSANENDDTNDDMSDDSNDNEENKENFDEEERNEYNEEVGCDKNDDDNNENEVNIVRISLNENVDQGQQNHEQNKNIIKEKKKKYSPKTKVESEETNDIEKEQHTHAVDQSVPQSDSGNDLNRIGLIRQTATSSDISVETISDSD